MILLADSGSTTTEWYLIRKDYPGIRVQSEGLNPYFITADKAESVILKEVVPLVFPEKIDTVYFYGAGCSRTTKRDLISDVLGNCFPRADIEVYTDILGAGRAIFGNARGIAGILGTGSNLAVYGGKDIEYILPSLGYILGDEGSGTSLGFTLLRAFLRSELPEYLLERFEQKYHLDHQVIMDAIYHQPFPNRWAASFTRFLKENINEPFIEEMVTNNFRYFVHKNILKFSDYKDLNIGFTGSVALHFSDQLKKAASEKGIQISSIIASPVEGLVKYHTPAEWAQPFAGN
ncbi:MAG: ATPase [Bacteroidales bacterium]